MHCGFQRTITQTDASQKHFLSRESIEQDPFNAHLKDCEVSSDMWMTNSNNNRCTILTFIAVEPTGHCRIVSVPIECSDNTIPLGSRSADRRKSPKGPTTNPSYFVRPGTSRSNFQHQSQNEDELRENKEDKATKRNSRKKPRKKGKRNKKLSIGVSECSTSEADANKSSSIDIIGSCTADMDASQSFVASVPQNLINYNTHHLSGSENGEVQDTCCKPIGSCDSVSLASNSDYSFNAADEENGGTGDLSKSPHYATKKCSAPIEKRDKQHIKRLPKNSIIYRGSNVGNSQGRFGKENSHSVWQRVERNNAAADECSNNSSTKLHSQSNVPDSDILSNIEDKSQTKLMLSGKMKRKSIKQDGSNYYARKESHVIKSRSNLGTTDNTKQNGISEEPELDSSKVDCPRNGFQSKKVESIAFKQVCELEPLESSHQELLEELVDEPKVIKQMCSTEQTRQETTSGTIMQRWVPVGVKDQPRNLPMALQEGSACGSQTLVLEEAVNCLILETEERDDDDGGDASTAENNLSKMGCALNDVKRAQRVSEAIYNATGCPIAEFERLLHSASPVICQSDNMVSCQRCLHDPVFRESLCMHETPNITLGNVWEWYEEHGIYGLKVTANNYENSKRMGMDSVAFDAYFAPSLSAVQLFRKCNSTGDLQNLELLFEYFESEQPQKRRSLFDTIKELVNGHLQGGAYGDPTILESVGLNDLHPESWYSVAWYPIYTIPDGNLRAAFLTYHSLGHLVRRSSSSFDSLCEDVSIVSPVVGLQSYNVQGECWFRPRHKETIEESSNLNHAGVLKERIRTLEHTASLMARATVTKGTQTYSSRQPDYEFFLSRRC